MGIKTFKVYFQMTLYSYWSHKPLFFSQEMEPLFMQKLNDYCDPFTVLKIF